MDPSCPRCNRINPPEARFCGRCGISIETDIGGGGPVPGRLRHPQPVPVPEGFERIVDTPDLYYRLESAWGGRRLLDTENVGVALFNAGYSLLEVVVDVHGVDDNRKELFLSQQTAERLPQGELINVEVPSYDMTTSPATFTVSFVSAEFEPPE